MLILISKINKSYNFDKKWISLIKITFYNDR
jgi:hypothetical protein